MIENCRNEPAGTYPSLSDGSRCLVLRARAGGRAWGHGV